MRKIVILLLVFSCSTPKKFLDEGLKKGYIDTSIVRRDTAFLLKTDTLHQVFTRDSIFRRIDTVLKDCPKRLLVARQIDSIVTDKTKRPCFTIDGKGIHLTTPTGKVLLSIVGDSLKAEIIEHKCDVKVCPQKSFWDKCREDFILIVIGFAVGCVFVGIVRR